MTEVEEPQAEDFTVLSGGFFFSTDDGDCDLGKRGDALSDTHVSMSTLSEGRCWCAVLSLRYQ